MQENQAPATVPEQGSATPAPGEAVTLDIHPVMYGHQVQLKEGGEHGEA